MEQHITIPTSLRDRFDVEPGDKLRGSVDDDGGLTVEVVQQRCGAFEDFEAVPMGGDGLETHDLAGHEDGLPAQVLPPGLIVDADSEHSR